jgi:hypothetical protein
MNGFFEEEDKVFLTLKHPWLPRPLPDYTLIDGRWLTYSGVPNITYDVIELNSPTLVTRVAGKKNIDFRFNSTLVLEPGERYCIITEEMCIVGMLTVRQYYYNNFDYEFSVDYFVSKDGLI